MLLVYDDLGVMINLSPGCWSIIEKQSSTIPDPTGVDKLGKASYTIVFVTPGGAMKQVSFPTSEIRDHQFTEIMRTLHQEQRTNQSNVIPVGIRPNINGPVQRR